MSRGHAAREQGVGPLVASAAAWDPALALAPGDQASCGPAAWADPGRRARPRRHAEPGTEALPLGDPRLCSEAAAAGRSRAPGTGPQRG